MSDNILLHGTQRYFVVSGYGIFVYDSGDFCLTESPHLVRGHHNLLGASKARAHARERYRSGEIFRGRVVLISEGAVAEHEIEDAVKAAALAKLTDEERRVLRLTPRSTR